MIFRPQLVARILAQQKTETRRPVKDGEQECRYRVGHSYAVQPGRGKKGVINVKVAAVERARLHAITDEDAKREGFKTRDDFLAYWENLHGNRDDVEVWVVRFAIDTEHRPRLLARDPARGYTSDPALALEGEPEAVDPAELALRAEENERRLRRHRRDERREARRTVPLPRRLAEGIALADRLGVNVEDDLRVISRRLQAIEDRLDRSGAVAA